MNASHSNSRVIPSGVTSFTFMSTKKTNKNSDIYSREEQRVELGDGMAR